MREGQRDVRKKGVRAEEGGIKEGREGGEEGGMGRTDE